MCESTWGVLNFLHRAFLEDHSGMGTTSIDWFDALRKHSCHLEHKSPLLPPGASSLRCRDTSKVQWQGRPRSCGNCLHLARYYPHSHPQQEVAVRRAMNRSWLQTNQSSQCDVTLKHARRQYLSWHLGRCLRLLRPEICSLLWGLYAHLSRLRKYELYLQPWFFFMKAFNIPLPIHLSRHFFSTEIVSSSSRPPVFISLFQMPAPLPLPDLCSGLNRPLLSNNRVANSNVSCEGSYIYS